MKSVPHRDRNIRIGYQRAPDGGAVPVCEPPIDQVLLFLWHHVSLVTVQGGDAFLITADLKGETSFKGSMKPNDLVQALSRLIHQLVKDARETIKSVHDIYPFDMHAKAVVGQADLNLLMALDEAFVEVVPPRVVHGATFQVEQPLIRKGRGTARVVVTGYLPINPFKDWANEEIRDTMRDRIIAELANTPVRGTGFA